MRTDRTAITTIVIVSAILSHTAHSRQHSVLFVEDNAGYGTAAHPDSLWYTVLANIYGTGNFGWFGPTTGKFQNGPDLESMQNYDLVIWNNYDHYGQPLPLSPTLTAADQANITAYIDSGGRFWLIAQDALHSGVPLAFFQCNFHLNNYSPGIIGVAWTHLQGLAEAAGPEFLVTADYVASTVFWHDDLIPDANAHRILKDTDHNFYPGILRDDSAASFWTIDGRMPVPASTWEELVMDMLNIFGVTPGVTEQTSPALHCGARITVSPTTFNDRTVVSYSIPAAGYVQLRIYNAAGEHVATLMEGYQTATTSAITWRPRVQCRRHIVSGVYFAGLSYEGSVVTAKLILIE
jgi:hypothetical protein